MIATDTPEKYLIAARKANKVKMKKVKTGDLFGEKKKCNKIEKGEEIFNPGSLSGGEQFLTDSEDDEIILDEDFLPLARNPKVGGYVIVMILKFPHS